MIIDFHTHIGKDKELDRQSIESLKRKCIENGVDRCVVFPFDNSDEGLIQDSLDLLKRSKTESFLIPFLRFSPKTITRDELIRLLPGFKGVKLHPHSQDFTIDDKSLYWIYEIISENKLPLIFHCSLRHTGSDPKRVLTLSKDFPDLCMIISHFFGDDMGIIPGIKDFGNIYTDTSIYCRTLRLTKAMHKFGFDRILFGSDEPYDSQKVAMLKIHQSDLTPAEIEKILSGNAIKVLGLDNPDKVNQILGQ